MKKLIVLIACLFAIPNLIAQTPQQNLDKYWFYRHRLKTKFMVSKNQNTIAGDLINGINIPASSRNTLIDPNISEGGYQKTLKWGDALKNIGYYMGVVATEYRLLKDAGQSTEETIQEIVNTLQTLERLDMRAEEYYEYIYFNYFDLSPCITLSVHCFERIERFNINRINFTDNPVNLNGFYIRDDVPGFHNNDLSPVFFENMSSVWGGSGYPEFLSTPYVDSDGAIPFSNEMSQDMVWNMLLGVALVKHLTADCPQTFTDALGETVTLKLWAKKIAYRTLKWMQQGSNWQIYNKVFGSHVKRGGSVVDLTPNAYLFAEAGNWITEKEWGTLHFGLNDIESLADPDKHPLPYDLLVSTPRKGTDLAKLTLSTICGKKYAASFNAVHTNIRKCAAYYNQYFTTNQNSIKYYAFEHFPLLYIVFHGFDSNYETDMASHYYFSYIERILNIAPTEGTWRVVNDVNGDGLFTYDDYPNVEWSTGNKLLTPLGVQYHYQHFHDASQQIPGEYNGLDFMLLNNLYWIVHKELMKKTKEIPENIYFGTNTPSGVYGYVFADKDCPDYPIPYRITANEITTSCKIVNGGELILRCNNLKIEDDFKIEAGATFRVEPNPYNSTVYDK